MIERTGETRKICVHVLIKKPKMDKYAEVKELEGFLLPIKGREHRKWRENGQGQFKVVLNVSLVGL